MVRPNVERSEDTIIALNVDPRNVNVKILREALAGFFKKKHELDNSDRFNLVLFRGNPAYLENFTFKSDYLLSLIKDDVQAINTIPVENIIFMALTFLIDVYKSVGNKFFRIIILTDQDMKHVQNEFMVQDLLGITKEMPVFIDVVRINVKPGDDSDREKLEKVINMSKGGELVYVPKSKKLGAALLELAEKKFNENEDVFEEVREIKIPDEHAMFYENLASDPRIIDEPGTTKCVACFQTEQPGNMLFTCPFCENAVMHETCWAYWSKTSNIGVRHVFRCPICYRMLRLPRAFVEDVLGAQEDEVIDETVQNVVVTDQTEALKAQDDENAPKLIEALLDTL